MKFTVSYSSKIKSPKPYETFSILAAIESDTGVEPMEATFARARTFVITKVAEEQKRLQEEAHAEVNKN